MTQPHVHVRAGDTVLVLEGKRGKVQGVDLREGKVHVEGVNLVKKAMRPTEDNPEGGVAEREAPLHASNLKVVEAADRKEAE